MGGLDAGDALASATPRVGHSVSNIITISAPPFPPFFLDTAMGGSAHFSAAFITLLCCIQRWYKEISLVVPRPYLDEVFHVRQAQAYWAGNWTTWDPKITTPPGLYVCTYAFNWGGSLIDPRWDGNNIQSMRLFNASLLALWLFYRVWTLVRLSEKGNRSAFTGRSVEDENSAHAALNICLFPIVFFFSSLYYTDALSVCAVLEATYWHTRQQESNNALSTNNFFLLLFGLLSLTVRQTNVFWVSVYLGGIQVIRQLPAHGSGSAHQANPLNTAWTRGRLHDLPVAEVKLEGLFLPFPHNHQTIPLTLVIDYLLTMLTLPLASIRFALSLLPTLWPYLTLLITFTTFLLLNGSVVLGDKSNHIASIHLPQLLYLWPYLIFFSWPLVLPHFLSLLIRPRRLLPRLPILATSTLLMGLAVKFNTLIHPFTLADNRHYTFYVFRILLLHPSLFYLAIPVYLLCAILALSALTTPPNTKPQPYHHPLPTSWVLVWLLATAGSVVTAPLVEPRYFVLPWLLWRLHIPHWSQPLSSPSAKQRQHPSRKRAAKRGIVGKWVEELRDYDHRLIMETVWYLVVNGVTGYVFLYRGFEWKQEPGEVQRFMW